MSYCAGVDSGSLTCDAVILDSTGAIVAAEILPTGARVRASAERALESVLRRAGLVRADLAAVVATGYGRDGVEGRTRSVTEIRAHARGAAHLLPGTRLVLDVGGQDCKAILVGQDGGVLDFAMNDKCAAGTGRFFEVMARALEVDLDDFGPLACSATGCVPISSVCTVFAESEVVSLIAQGEQVSSILSGLCRAAAERVHRLAQRTGVVDPVALTGGVAKNSGFRAAIERLLGVPVRVPPEPQIVGALGAALIGRDECA